MNPGPVEEGGKVITTLIESMKANPVMLGVLVFNIAAVMLVYFSSKEFRATNDRVISALLEQHKDMVEMISKCVVPSLPPTP